MGGMDKIQDSAKFSQKFTSLSQSNEYEIALEIQEPNAEDGGDYKCLVKNDHGQLQAKLNLNIEAEPAAPGKTMDAPTFVEKPKIVTLNEGKLVQLIVRYKASSKCTCQWYYKETKIEQSQSMQVFHEKVDSTSYECGLEIKEPGANTAGMYKCLVSNEKGEINANLMLNVQMATSETQVETKEKSRKVSTTGVSVKKERRKSVILQCAVSGQKDVEITWKKGGSELETTEKKKSSRYSVEKKFSEQNQTVIQLEIMEADVTDSGVYELVAKNAEGETQSQTVELTSEQVEMSLKAQEEAAETKAKKKKKKKKKTVEKKELIAPEISSFLRNYILKEGENIDMKCRLEEEIEEGDVEVTWTHNEKVITSSDRVQITFDGTFAKLFVACCKMEDMGSYKCSFKNAKGEDSTQGKVTVKPAPKTEAPKEPSPVKEPETVQPKKSFLSQKKKEPEPPKEEEKPPAEGDMFKLKKKSSVTPRKPIQKEEEQPAFAGFKLKKAETVKRQWDDGGLENVNLKHHEFEKAPQDEQPERNTEVLLSEG